MRWQKKAKKPPVRRPANGNKSKKPGTEKDRRLNPSELRALNAWFQLVPTELQKKALVQVGSKALVNSSFRKMLIADPRKALKAIGVVIPAGMRLNFLENIPRNVQVVLPPVGGFAKAKVIIRDKDLKAAFSDGPTDLGDRDTKAGDFQKDPTAGDFNAKNVTVTNNGAVGEFTNKPRVYDFSLTTTASTADGTDPVKKDAKDPTAKDNFWSDA